MPGKLAICHPQATSGENVSTLRQEALKIRVHAKPQATLIFVSVGNLCSFCQQPRFDRLTLCIHSGLTRKMMCQQRRFLTIIVANTQLGKNFQCLCNFLDAEAAVVKRRRAKTTPLIIVYRLRYKHDCEGTGYSQLKRTANFRARKNKSAEPLKHNGNRQPC